MTDVSSYRSLFVRVPNKDSFYSKIAEQIHVSGEEGGGLIVTNSKLFWRLPDDAQIYVTEDRTMGTVTIRDLKRELKEFHRKQMNKKQ